MEMQSYETNLLVKSSDISHFYQGQVSCVENEIF